MIYTFFICSLLFLGIQLQGMENPEEIALTIITPYGNQTYDLSLATTVDAIKELLLVKIRLLPDKQFLHVMVPALEKYTFYTTALHPLASDVTVKEIEEKYHTSTLYLYIASSTFTKK